MKQIITLIAVFVTSMTFAQLTTPPQTARKVQVAILFDTSNSMDGLIDQAKSRIWNIVNEISTLQYNNQAPTFEFALYEYGNDGLSMTNNYIRQVSSLTSDLDDISTHLFGLKTNGGSEFCGAVIQQSINDLEWSDVPTDLKMIYIAGNEGFDQGPVNYKKVCELAKEKSIFVNTIFCGDYNRGIQLHWQDGATCSTGDYFNIDSDKKIQHIATPYDKEIQVYNDSLNTTYYGYGRLGSQKKRLQSEQDVNANQMDASVATERVLAKSKKAVYRNSSWDLLDAVDNGKDISTFKEEELPKEFKGKTLEEKKALVTEKTKDRERYQTKIAELGVERQKFIDKKRKESTESVDDDFGTSVNNSMVKKAKEIGFEQETAKPNQP